MAEFVTPDSVQLSLSRSPTDERREEMSGLINELQNPPLYNKFQLNFCTLYTPGGPAVLGLRSDRIDDRQISNTRDNITRPVLLRPARFRFPISETTAHSTQRGVGWFRNGLSRSCPVSLPSRLSIIAKVPRVPFSGLFFFSSKS